MRKILMTTLKLPLYTHNLEYIRLHVTKTTACISIMTLLDVQNIVKRTISEEINTLQHVNCPRWYNMIIINIHLFKVISERFQSHFSEYALMFCPNLCNYMDNSLVMFWKSFLVLLRFLVKNAKNNIFEDKCFLSKMFYQI